MSVGQGIWDWPGTTPGSEGRVFWGHRPVSKHHAELIQNRIQFHLQLLQTVCSFRVQLYPQEAGLAKLVLLCFPPFLCPHSSLLGPLPQCLLKPLSSNHSRPQAKLLVYTQSGEGGVLWPGSSGTKEKCSNPKP